MKITAFLFTFIKILHMKKLLLLSLLLISWGVKSQQAATSNNQQIEIGKLQLLLQAFQAGNTTTISVTTGTFQLVCSTSSVSTTGSITTGNKAILIEASSDFSGIIDGNRFLSGGIMSMPLGAGAIYPAVNYTINAGALYLKTWK
jgi:hypothetical protein